MLGEYAARDRVDAVGMDTGMDPAAAVALAGRVALQGNLDPMALVAGGPALTATDAILAPLRGKRLIFNLGHGIVPQTPPEHVAALVEHTCRAA